MIYGKVKLSKEDSRKIMNETMDFFNRTLKGFGYEVRDGQTDMALDIVDAMIDNQHIAVEAGVGIGKSFAYLVPLILYNKFSRYPVVIATSSIALQEQLKDDIKIVSKLLDEFPKIILAKGKRNYACLQKCLEINTSNSSEQKLLEDLVKYVQAGVIDKADLPDISNKKWSQLNAENCKSSKCIYKSRCVLIKDREKIKRATGVIVTNQDMLIQNLLNRQDFRGELFSNDIKYVVIDEAHNFEEKVRNAFTNKWTFNSLKHTMNEVLKSVRYERSDMSKKVNLLNYLLEKLFNSLNTQVENQIGLEDLEDGVRFFLDAKEINQITTNLINHLDSFLIQATMHDDDRYDYSDNSYQSLYDFLVLLRALIEDDSNWLFWLNRAGKDMSSVSIEACPKRVNNKTYELMFNDNNIRIIFTSATMTHLRGTNDEESYSYFINNISFPTNTSKGFISTPKDSPFPYDKNSILYTSDNLPTYKNDKDLFILEGIKEIVNLAEITNGKMLVLFTSKKDMNEVYMQIKELKLPWNILIQDGSSSQLDILARFKMDVNSILLGTGTFWEGISIEGEALSCVVIFRLPFPVPDPIVEYKSSISKDRMKEVLLPHMIIKLKQGIGRLIRSSTDNGIVAILDPRLGEKSKVVYKDTVWESLPIKKRTNELSQVKEFFDSLQR